MFFLLIENLIQLSNPASTCYADTYATTTLTCSGEQLCFVNMNFLYFIQLFLVYLLILLFIRQDRLTNPFFSFLLYQKSIALPSYTVQRGCSYDNLTSMNQIIYASNICLNTGCFNTTGTDTLVRIYLCEQDLCNRATVTSYLKPLILLSTVSYVLLYFLS